MAKKPKNNPPKKEFEESRDFSSGLSTPQIMDESFAEVEDENSPIANRPSPEFLLSAEENADTAETGDTAGVWHNGKKITALWSNTQTRNAWASVSTLGWRKLANNNDLAVTAINILTSHAKEDDRNANVRIDKDQIVEIYVW